VTLDVVEAVGADAEGKAIGGPENVYERTLPAALAIRLV
jgi:hypothetical protein